MTTLPPLPSRRNQVTSSSSPAPDEHVVGRLPTLAAPAIRPEDLHAAMRDEEQHEAYRPTLAVPTAVVSSPVPKPASKKGRGKQLALILVGAGLLLGGLLYGALSLHLF